jgi:DNA-binding XRE family transcriptional regulator
MSKNLAKVRKQKGKTQTEMAKLLGIGVSTYNLYENGAHKTPREIAVGIAEILEIEVEAIFLPATFTVCKSEESERRLSEIFFIT